jgi:hypothetical protein
MAIVPPAQEKGAHIRHPGTIVFAFPPRSAPYFSPNAERGGNGHSMFWKTTLVVWLLGLLYYLAHGVLGSDLIVGAGWAALVGLLVATGLVGLKKLLWDFWQEP